MFSFYYHWITIYLHSPYYLICSPSTTIGLRYISSLHTISYVLLLLPLDYEISPSTTIRLRYISTLHTISYVLLLLPLDYEISPSTTIRLRYISTLHTISYVLLLLPLDYNISPLFILSHMFSFYYHWITIYLLSPYYLICSPSTTIGLRYISTLHTISYVLLLLPLDYDISPLFILSHMFSFYYHWITIYLLSPYYLICSPSTTIGLRYISTLHTISYVLLLLPLDYDISPLSILSHMFSFYYHWITKYLLLLPLDYDISPLSILSHMFSFYYHWITIYLHSPYYLICSPSTTIGLRYISTLHTISYVLLLLPLDYDLSPLSILSHMFSFYYH